MIKALVYTVISASLVLNTTQLTLASTDVKYSSSNTNTVKNLNVGMSYYAGTDLSPQRYRSDNDEWILDHMFKGLYTETPSGIIEPALVEDYKISDDGLVWTFTLKDYNWSSGNKGTAYDFEYAFKDMLDPNNAYVYAQVLCFLENAEAYNSGIIDSSEVGVKTLDERTLQLTLVEPMPYLPSILANSHLAPVDYKNAEKYPDWYLSGEHYSANGPFTLATNNFEENEIVLKKNNSYYDKDLTKLDSINIRFDYEDEELEKAYNENQIDFAFQPYFAETEIQTSDDFSTYFYYINTDVKPLNNPKVRKALSMAINREDITENLDTSKPKPAYTVIPAGFIDSNGVNYSERVGKLFEEDYTEAKKLLKEGLAEEGVSLEDWEFTLSYNVSSTHADVAKTIQTSWKNNLGINCKLKEVEFQVLLDDRETGNFEISRAGWMGDYYDPYTFLKLFTSSSNFNDANWKNEEYDELIKKSNSTNDVEERMNYLKQAETILINEMPFIPLYQYTKKMAIHENVVGYYNPLNGHTNFEFAEIVK